jgi:predicted transcriptional regulator
MNTAKQELIELLERLPDDAPMDSLLAETHFKASVLRGLEEAERGDVVSHEEVMRRLSAWRSSPGLRRFSAIGDDA